MSGWEDDHPGLPIKFGPCSNAEYDPDPLTPVMRAAIRRSLDEDAARESLAGDEFIFDIQGHLLEYDLNPTVNSEGAAFWSLFPQQDCGAEDPRDCYSIEQFLELMFIRSDTSAVVISALPIAPEGSPLSLAVMEETSRVAEALCRDNRVLLH